MPWKDKDDFDKYINQTRLNLRKGVLKRYNDGHIKQNIKNYLNYICDKVDIVFFYPIIYTVDINNPCVSVKLSGTNWSAKGSQEYAVDLLEGEYDLLFLDFNGDTDFNQLKDKKLTPVNALSILMRRC